MATWKDLAFSCLALFCVKLEIFLMDYMNAAILNGGKSRRMGEDKAMLQFNGEAIIDRLFTLLNSSFTSVAIVGADDDIYQGIGVLGGLHSALKKSAQRLAL